MKKPILILSCIILCLPLLLNACSDKKDSGKEEASPSQTAAAAAAEPEKENAAEPAPVEEPTPSEEPAPAEEPAPVKEREVLPDFNTDTEFDSALLKNWNDDALREAYGVESIMDFTPADPQPRTYIISTAEVIDPVTGQLSEGGYSRNSARHLPIDTHELMWLSGRVWGGGLILTDDPDKAAYALILDFDYTDSTGTFTFSDKSRVTQYHAATQATLLDLVTKESIATEKKKSWATQTGESVSRDMLEAAKGKQLYSDSASIEVGDFPYYWEFLAGGQRREEAVAAAEQGLSVITLLPHTFDILTRQELADYLQEPETGNVILQEDGCVTVILSEEELQERMTAAQEEADALAAELEETAGITRNYVSADMTHSYFTDNGEQDIETFAGYAEHIQFHNKVYAILDGHPTYRIIVTLEDADTGKKIYEIDSALMDD